MSDKDNYIAGAVNALLYVLARQEMEKGKGLVVILLEMQQTRNNFEDPLYNKGFNAAIDQLIEYLREDTASQKGQRSSIGFPLPRGS